MGKVRQVLAESKLDKRDSHNGRMFVDICENIHFHYREFRFVFSVPEFRVFAKAIGDGCRKMNELVSQGYKECMDHKERVKSKIIGGNQSKEMPLPDPISSAYFNNRFVIEEQANKEIDLFHIHYRDFRIAIDTEKTFLDFCKTVEEAKTKWLESKSQS